jgi:hypothetical protein
MDYILLSLSWANTLGLTALNFCCFLVCLIPDSGFAIVVGRGGQLCSQAQGSHLGSSPVPRQHHAAWIHEREKAENHRQHGLLTVDLAIWSLHSPKQYSTLPSWTFCLNFTYFHSIKKLISMKLINLSYVQSGCCKPPTGCNFTYQSETVWIKRAGFKPTTDDPDWTTWCRPPGGSTPSPLTGTPFASSVALLHR